MTEVNQYKKALKKHLHCSGPVRDRLIKGFDASMTAFLEDIPSPGHEEVYAAFGSPKEMAELLMTEVTTEEAALYRRQNTLLRTVAGVLASVLLAGTIYIYFFKEQNISYNNTVDVDKRVLTETSFVVDGQMSVD